MSGARNLNRLTGVHERLQHQAATGPCKLHQDRPAVGFIESWNLQPKGCCAQCAEYGKAHGYSIGPDPWANDGIEHDHSGCTHLPKRIQLRRTKGWRMPRGAVVVARPGRWGNPFVVGQEIPDLIPGLLEFKAIKIPILDDLNPDLVVLSAEHAVALYRAYLDACPEVAAAARQELAGKDLACWCPVPAEWPCHADVLLEVANPGGPRQ